VVHEVTSDSSDSDVIILPSDDTQTPSTTRRQRPHALLPRSRSPVAGPSRVCCALNVALIQGFYSFKCHFRLWTDRRNCNVMCLLVLYSLASVVWCVRARACKTAINDYLLGHVCLSVPLSVSME